MANMTTVTCLIPARMESKRFPGKALAPIKKYPMVVHCAINSIEAGLETFVCTDHELIQEACCKEYINVVRTPHFNTGTDRCNWAAKQLTTDNIIILQGDEPLINSSMLDQFRKSVESIKNDNILVNGLNPISAHGDDDLNTVKAYCENNNIYKLTRKPIAKKYHLKTLIPLKHYRQLGLYGGTPRAFEIFHTLTKSAIEANEGIEMLRWLSNGKQLIAAPLAGALLSVDTPADLRNVQNILRDNVSFSTA